jgi:outer membrane protein OmpA-like peptidoglycan-associated protein
MIADSKPIIISAALAVSSLLAACVTAPPDNSLAEARAAVNSAAANPDVVRYDALDLDMAQKQLANAESAAERDAPDMAEHEAYLAIRTAKLAEVRADQVAAQQRVAVVAGERVQAQLDARVDARAQVDRLNVEPAARTVMILLTDDYFEPGQAQLMPAAGKIVDDLAEFLIAHPERRVRIEGHSDNAGANEPNLSLPLHRAETVRMALVARGVDPVRSEAVAYGPDNPLSASENPADSHFIRGVEILLSDSRGQIASR